MEPRDIKLFRKKPLNRLFFAINHYISTGDHIGEGIAMPAGSGNVKIIVPVNRYIQADRDDIEKLRSKFEEIGDKFHVYLEKIGEDGRFDYWSFNVHESRMDDLARELRRAPGPAGWGSCKTIIDETEWVEDVYEGDLYDRFISLLNQFDSIADVEKLTSRSRRTFELKRDKQRPVVMYDILALERALQIKRKG